MSKHNPICISDYTFNDLSLDYAFEAYSDGLPTNSDDYDVWLEEVTAAHYGCLDSMLVRKLEAPGRAYSEWPHDGEFPA